MSAPPAAPGGAPPLPPPRAAPGDLVSCTDAVNALFACGGPAHQLDRYYKDGRLDGCARQLAELSLCARLKAGDSPETRRLVRSLLEEPRSPTIGVVWPAALVAVAAPPAAVAAAPAAAVRAQAAPPG